MTTAFIHTKAPCKDGLFDSYLTTQVEVKETNAMPNKGRTVTGYGSAMPTGYMVKFNGRWHRVKVICFSNSGTAFIGAKYDQYLTVSIEH